MPYVLASGSAIRRELLMHAGIDSRAVPSNIDETPIKVFCRENFLTTQQTALKLAHAKALDVASREPDAFVIGADQILDCEGQWLDKPLDRRDAEDQLRALNNRTHQLVTAVCIFQNSDELWSHCEVAALSMVSLDEASIARYLDGAGEAAFQSVGAYQVEGHGIRLFNRIDGDFFSILGLPLVPLLRELRTLGDAIP